MLPEIIKHVHSYWERPYTKWGLITWENFYANKYPSKTKQESHDSFRCDLDVLLSKLEPKTGIHDKALALKRDFLNLKKRKRYNEKENSINENDPKKTKYEISTERRFPNNISSWNNFNSEVQSWNPESVNIYKTPTFSSRTITCEKDIWTAAEINIHDVLTPLNRSISFLDGRSLPNVIGEPDFIVVNKSYTVLMPIEYKTCWVLRVPSNKHIVDLYLHEKDVQEGNITGSKHTSAYDAINQIYGYMCVNKLRYGVLSTFDQTFFLKRNVKGNKGFLQISDAVTNVSIEPTLLKSISYIISLSSNNRYSKFIDKPIMITKELSPDTSEEEQKNIIAYKYKGKKISTTKEPNVLTRNRS
ncbi:27165_t:CDS:2, partial [Racocetra persica]